MHGSTRVDRLGEEIINKQGLKMKIIKYTKYIDIDVEFEDGYVSKHKQYGAFKIGGIDNPNYYCANGKLRYRLGEEFTTLLGRNVKIIKYIDSNNITVLIDNNIEIETSYRRFKDGNIDNIFIKDDMLGKKNTNQDGIEMEIINFKNSLSCDVLFYDGLNTVRKNVTYDNFINGKVTCPSKKNKLGGIISDRSRTNKEKRIKSIWYFLLTRTTQDEFKNKHPAYKDCTICEEWKDLCLFEKWYLENEYRLKKDKLEIDKDFLICGNKHYSPETCVLLPQKINRTLSGMNRKRKYMQGVSKSGNKYKTSILKNKEKIFLGTFDSEYDAFLAYKKEKENIIHELAIEYKEELPSNIFEMLIRWEFNYGGKV